jgi:cyanophycin synthetase
MSVLKILTVLLILLFLFYITFGAEFFTASPSLTLPPRTIKHKIVTGPNRYSSYPIIEFGGISNPNEILRQVVVLSKAIGFEPLFYTVHKNKMVIHYDVPDVMIAMVEHIVADVSGKIDDATRKKFIDLYGSLKLGPSTKSLIDECKRRNIPYIRLNKNSLFQVGYGIHRKMIEASCTSKTLSIAESIAKDKDLTKNVLKSIGIPVPKGYFIDNKDDLLTHYRTFDTPVVLKPYDGNHGDGVITNIRSEQELVQAYEIVKRINPMMILESFIVGSDYRVLVVGEKVVAVAKRTPPFVIGDGKHTIFQLVEQLNQDPKRGNGHSSLLTRVEFDETMVYYLSTQGLSKDTIPEKDKKVVLRNNGNLSSGGSAEDVTDLIHPETAHDCVLACKQIGLNICGLDIIANDISQPLSKQGAIIEMNSGPGLRMHIAPNKGQGRNVASYIIDDLVNDQPSRIPIVAITGTNGKTTTVQLTNHLLKGRYSIVGKTTTNGVYINDKNIDKGDCSGPSSAEKVLMNPTVEAAVFEVARGGILRKGLGYDKALVGCITNIGEGDHLGEHYDDSTIEDLIEIKSTVIRNILPGGYVVLNADDPYYQTLLKYVDPSVHLITFSKHKSATIEYHAADRVIICNGDTAGVFHLPSIPIINEPMDFQVENVMASIGCAIGCGIHPSTIQKQLSTFVNDATTNPGRMNVIEYNDTTIVLDYAHNIDSIKNICQYASQDKFKTYHKMVSYGPAGDRDTATLQTICAMLVKTFHLPIFFVDEKTKRGKTEEELFTLMKSTGGAKSHYVYGEKNAIQEGLNRCKEKHLFVILVDDVEYIISHVNSWVNTQKRG